MLSYQEATAKDAPLISHVFAASWRIAYRGIINDHYLDRLPDEYWVPTLRAWLESGRLNGLLLLSEGQVAGCAVYGRGRDEDHGDWGEIVSFYMLPEKTRRGYGTALLTEVMRRLRAEGYTRFYLWAIDGNQAADSFYRRCGFHPTGDKVQYSIGSTQVQDVRYVLVDRS